jgi:ATP-dependent exoDNAse (exonuclease V) alpha subunit
MISAGEWITASGVWLNDRNHGLQFKAHFLKTSAPSSIEGIEKYLGSGMIKGIGPVYAKRLVKMFGKDVFDIIEETPTRLREVEGIGPTRGKKLVVLVGQKRAVAIAVKNVSGRKRWSKLNDWLRDGKLSLIGKR